jgi:Na+-transporting NADH:ubiquinone oxidoreductase subunit C
MPRESIGKTYLVAVVHAIACSLLVSGAAVGLRGWQKANKQLDMKRNILEAAGLYDPDVSVAEAFARIDTRVVDLASGQYADPDRVEPEMFDQRNASADSAQSIAIAAEDDLAGIGRREKYSLVYLVRQEDRVDQIVLPVRGRGLWATMYGYVAVDADLSSVRGITFYEHKETPGLGGEVENPLWRALWVGKQIFSDDGKVAIRVSTVSAGGSDMEARYAVDAVSGATFTMNSVTAMMQYWFGKHAFGPFLDRLRQNGAGDG